MKTVLFLLFPVTVFAQQPDTSRYSKTLDDSVFVAGDLILVPDIRTSFDHPVGEAEPDSSTRAIIAFFERNPFIIAEIIVHTDTRGSAEANLAISLQQAQGIVLRVCESDSIIPERLVPVGRGEREPVYPEAYINGFKNDKTQYEGLHQANRRVEIRVTGFLGPRFYELRRQASRAIELQDRGSARYEDLLLIADTALLAGDYQTAMKYYEMASNLAPAEDPYAADQYRKLKELVKQPGDD